MMLKKRIKSARHAMSATRARITFVFENPSLVLKDVLPKRAPSSKSEVRNSKFETSLKFEYLITETCCH